MSPAKEKPERTNSVSLFLAALMVLFGFEFVLAGYATLRIWSSIGAAYAALGVLWIVAGPVMLACGVWALATLARQRIPLWIGGVATALCGGSLIAGVLSYVVPCSGPS